MWNESPARGSLFCIYLCQLLWEQMLIIFDFSYIIHLMWYLGSTVQPILSFLCQLLWVLSSIIFHFSYLHIYCGACVRLSCLNLCQLLSLSQRRLETAKGGKLAPNLQSLAKTLRKWWMGLFQGHVHTYIDFCETF